MRFVAGKKSDLGPIGANVTHTVRRFREERRLGYAELSRKLAELGRDIPPLGLRRIESGERKVDVDDLVALAFVFDISPLALLLPTEPSSLTSQGETYSFEQIWYWGEGLHPLPPEEPSRDFVRRARFLTESKPHMRADWEKFLRATTAGETGKEVRSDGDDQ
jgi:transcriptional regulator with XRE-family HTH domain